MATWRSEQLTEPMVIKCVVLEGFAGKRAPNLDALLMDVLSKRIEPMPFGDPHDWAPVPIPIAKSACGRFYLISSGEFEVDEHDEFIMSRRAPWVEYARLGDPSITRVNISVAEDKSYFTKQEKQLVKDDTITWYAVGSIDGIRDALNDCHYLAKYRGTGHGKIKSWSVETTKPWDDGFPVMQAGMPLRPLPLDAPGLSDVAAKAYRTIAPPYWLHDREELVAVPE